MTRKSANGQAQMRTKLPAQQLDFRKADNYDAIEKAGCKFMDFNTMCSDLSGIGS